MSNTTKKATKANITQLAKDIAAVMTNPALPGHLHDVFLGGLIDIENEAEVFGDSATDDIKRWLPLAINKLEAKEATA